MSDYIFVNTKYELLNRICLEKNVSPYDFNRVMTECYPTYYVLLHKPSEVQHLHASYADIMHPRTFLFHLTKDEILDSLDLFTSEIAKYSDYLLNNRGRLKSRMIDLANSPFSKEGFLAEILEDWKGVKPSNYFPSNITLGEWIKFYLNRDRVVQTRLEAISLSSIEKMKDLYEFSQRNFDWVVDQLLGNEEETLTSALSRVWSKIDSRGTKNAYFYVLAHLCDVFSEGVPQFLWYNYAKHELSEHLVRLDYGY